MFFFLFTYQDPVDPSKTIILIRSLVPGGVAEQDGRLSPGDRLMFVNDISLENGSLEEAVQALKGAPVGAVKIGVAKPLPVRILEFYGYFSCYLSWYIMIVISVYTLCVLGYKWVTKKGRFLFLSVFRTGLCSLQLVQ